MAFKQPKLLQNTIHPRVRTAFWLDGAVFIPNEDDMDDVFSRGCFGKGHINPRAPRKGLDDLYLTLPEAFFLQYATESLQILPLTVANAAETVQLAKADTERARREVAQAEGKVLDEWKQDSEAARALSMLPRWTVSETWTHFSRANPRFVPLYATYHFLRARGWVPRMGVKYGVDFVVYKDGPALFHADYCVCVKWVNAQGTPLDAYSSRDVKQVTLQGLLRMTHTVAKDLLNAYVVAPPGLDLSTPQCVQKMTVRCQLVRRWEAGRGRA